MKHLGMLVVLGVFIGGLAASCDKAGDKPPFETALLTGGGEVEIITLWDRITEDCQREGIQGRLPSGTLVGVTLVRNDCSPKMYFVGTGRDDENGWVSELFLEPR